MARTRLLRHLGAAALLASIITVGGGPSTAHAQQDLFAGTAADYFTALTTLSGDASGPHSLTLTGDIVIPGHADPLYTGTADLVIDGGGFILDGQDTSRLLQITGPTPGTVTFRDITIQNGEFQGLGGAIFSTGDVVIDDATITASNAGGPAALADVAGGAIHADDVTLTDATVSANTASASPASATTAKGGAIRATGNVVVTDSTISGNQAEAGAFEAEGGAISAAGTVDLTGSAITMNTATGKVNPSTSQPSQGGAVSAGGAVDVQNSELSQNAVVGPLVGAFGGGVAAAGNLTVADSTITENSVTSGTAPAGGGGLFASAAAIDVQRSTIANNTATGDQVANGGGLRTVGGAPATVIDSLIAGNRAEAVDVSAAFVSGGGISTPSALTTVTRSQVVDNEVDAVAGTTTGGGVDASGVGGAAQITDSALVRNRAVGPTGRGGAAVTTNAPITVTNSTVAGNEATTSGGGLSTINSVVLDHATVVANEAASATNLNVTANVTAEFSVVANPVTGNNCTIFGSTTSNGFNVESATDCGFDQVGAGDLQSTDPELGPARNNGGPAVGDDDGMPTGTPTESAYPLAGSVLVDAIPAGSCSGTLPTDQRGVERPFPVGGACDTGAVEQVYPDHPFTDVPPWVRDAVRWMTSDVNDPPLMTGFGDNTFRVNDNITRGQVVRQLYRLAGSPDVSGYAPHGFTDVDPWVEDAVTWAKGEGIVDGYPDNTFRVNLPITRAQVIRMEYRVAGSADTAGLPQPFTDVPPWVDTAVRWAANTDNPLPLVTGITPTTFEPDDNITRGQVVRSTYRLAITPNAWNDPGTAPPTVPFIAPPG